MFVSEPSRTTQLVASRTLLSEKLVSFRLRQIDQRHFRKDQEFDSSLLAPFHLSSFLVVGSLSLSLSVWAMEENCYLEVDVNGEEVFVVDKRVISSYSGKIRKLLSRLRDATGHLKVIFHDFPGGAANFEVITRFCYNKGKADINAFNIFHLISAAEFMEMNKSVDGADNLCEQTEKSMDEIKYWRWSELLMALKQFQNQHLGAVSLALLDKLLNSLVGRIALSSNTSPCPSASSSDSSGCDTRSLESFKSNNSFRAMWWFEDLVALDARVVEMLVKLMVSRNFGSGVISRFLFYYQKSRFASASFDEKIQIIEKVVEMLGSLDVNCVSCKSLFELLRVALKLRVSQLCRSKLESSIGSLLDQATLDSLLIPASPSKGYLYNVNLVLSFLKSFLGKGVDSAPLSRLHNVASLIDLYLAEIAPDPCLKPSKFLAVIRAVPDSARESFNGVYHAVNLYLEVHPGLSVGERRKLCSSLNYEKLSTAALSHLTQNGNFPLKYAALALVSQKSKLKSLLQCAEKPVATTHKDRNMEGCDQVVLYARKLNASGENERLKPRLQGMQRRVLEMEKMRKSRMSRHGHGRSLPMLCS